MIEEASRPEGDTYEWFRRAQALHGEGNPGAAAELLAHAAQREPQARSVREAWARALYDSRRYEQAAREFLALVEQAPDDHYAHFGAGMALWRLQRFRTSNEHLTMAAAMRPGRADYVQARRQVRATIAARARAGLAVDGPLQAAGSSPAAEPVPGPQSGGETVPLTEQVLHRMYDTALLDLDGVVYRGEQPVRHAVGCIHAARESGMRTAYVTNNASRTPQQVAALLRDMGIDADDADVVTSAQAGARLVREHTEPGSRVLAVGGPGVSRALQGNGLVPVRAEDLEQAPVTAVMMGFGKDVGWRDLAAASYAVAGGALFVATNTDLTYPSGRGIAPGNGALVAAVVQATGVEPLVAGKPHEPLMRYSVERTDALAPLVVGDRLDTDIEAAHRLGLASLLVLTGVTDAATLLRARPEQRPTYLAADLRGLLARGRLLHEGSAAHLDPAGRLMLGASADPADPLGRLRAAARACWTYAERGRTPEIAPDLLAALDADVALALAH